jgi:uncharacterized phage-associated protein
MATLVQFDRQKFRELVHYVCDQVDPDTLGAVKLHKVLYFADMWHYLRTGHPISGETYRKQHFGPVASHLLRTIEELEREGALERRKTAWPGGTRTEFHTKRSARVERLSKSEIAFVDEVIDFVIRKTAAEISEYSHHQVWQAAEMGEVLPYTTAFHMSPAEVTDADLEWAAEEYRRRAS